MASDDGYYTAWDGRQYVGSPPSGWFLAADNRWWPSPDSETDDQPAGPDDPPSISLDEPSNGSTTDGQEPASGSAVENNNPSTPSREQAPPASWAPMANEQQRAESEPASVGGQAQGQGPTTSAPVSRTRSRRSNRGGLLRRRVLPVVFFFFLLNRCGAAFGGDSTVNLDEFGPNASLAPAATEDFSLRNDCSPTFLWGSITNESSATMSFVARTARIDGGDNYDSEPTTVAPGEEASWSIPFSREDEPENFCPPVEILEVIAG